ncbi:MAG TPA: hypothetical protein VLG38_01655 [Gammaproteobacteria bacterium]|nr:hypothetical protein [Gammaproteobacteria bacterium]
MRDEASNWIEQLEVTGPIKGIMDFVDELARNYDRRLAALHIDYQKDVDEIVACYKQEKEEFHTQLKDQKELVTTLQGQLKDLQQSYNVLNVENKLNRESLATAREELAQLTQALKREEELVSLTKERIFVANENLKMELQARGLPAEPAKATAELSTPAAELPAEENEPVVRPRKVRFKRTREFLQQVVADRLSRPIILRPKKQDPIIPDTVEDIQDEDKEEYSF